MTVEEYIPLAAPVAIGTVYHAQQLSRTAGDGDFVEKVLAQATEQMERKYRIQNRGLKFETVVRHVADLMEMKVETVLSPGRYKQLVQARSLVCFWAVHEANISQAELSRRFAITQPAVSMAVTRGLDIASKMSLEFPELIK